MTFQSAKNLQYIFAAVPSFLFCENLGTNVLTLSLWGVIRWSFKPRVARNLNLLCRHCFGFYPPCNLTRPLKMELVLIPFWQRLHFLAFRHYVISDDISNERYPKINLDSISIICQSVKWQTYIIGSTLILLDMKSTLCSLTT